MIRQISGSDDVSVPLLCSGEGPHRVAPRFAQVLSTGNAAILDGVSIEAAATPDSCERGRPSGILMSVRL